MVVVPNVCPDTPALRTNPVFLYFQDGFRKPAPFEPDIAVAIDDVIEKKIDMIDAHDSQMYEWLPWVAGRLEQVPKDAAARREWLRKSRFRPGSFSDAVRAQLKQWYGDKAASIQHAEAFEVCEYGRRPTREELRSLFPFFPAQ
jgi:hypothetical protein